MSHPTRWKYSLIAEPMANDGFWRWSVWDMVACQRVESFNDERDAKQWIEAREFESGYAKDNPGESRAVSGVL